MSELPAPIELTDELGLQIVTPSGELIPVREASTEDIAAWIAGILEYEDVLRRAKRMVYEEVLRRQDLAASWTTEVRVGKLVGTSPEPRVGYDPAKLLQALVPLVEEGFISHEAMTAAVEPITSWKVKIAGVNKLKKLGEPVLSAVESAKVELPPDRSVKLQRRETHG